MQGKSLIAKGHSLINPQWIVDCDAQGKRLSLEECVPSLHLTKISSTRHSYYVHRADEPLFDGGEGSATEDEADSDDGEKRGMLVDEPKSIEQSSGEETRDGDEEFATLKDVRRAVPDSEDEDEAGLPGDGDVGANAAGVTAADQSWDQPSAPQKPTDEEEEDDSPPNHRYIAPAPGGMGEDTTANEYDPDLMFKPLVFYFDTKEHAAALAVRCPSLRYQVVRLSTTRRCPILPHSRAVILSLSKSLAISRRAAASWSMTWATLR